MIYNDPQDILGEWNYDNEKGRFFATEDKSSFVRFYSTGFREYISSRMHYEDGYEQLKWFVSLGYEKEFTRGEVPFDTKRQAEEFANDRDDLNYAYLMDESRELMKRHRDKNPIPVVEEYNPGF